MSERTQVVVVGAGISGLTAAFWLHQHGNEVTVLEKEGCVGGTMQTLRKDGWLVEMGPNSALETTPLFGEMFEALGISDQRIYAHPESNRRYILRDGTLHALPMSPGAFLKTRLWSAKAKLRLLGEPFVGSVGREESIAEFVERRLGREFLDYAINPFVAGVYAGNPEDLSVRLAFPKLYALEEKYGGLIKGMILGARDRRKRAETAKDRARMFSFTSGMQTFPDAIGLVLGKRLRLEATVRSVQRSRDGAGRNSGSFDVAYEEHGESRVLAADAVILATPAYVASTLLRDLSTPTANLLDEVYYPPVAEVFLGYREDQFTMPLDGFGYLVPARESRNILGTIWSSSIFPHRAPEGHVALTTFVGGARQPGLIDGDDDDCLRLVLEDLRSIMGVQGEPVYSRVVRWPKAIPQYNLGYQTLLSGLEALERELPGFFFCSNYKGGIAVGDCLMSGKRTAERVEKHVSETNGIRQKHKHTGER
jgi:oxygen-dependent protoporphyrinogen oxidase